MIYLSLLFQLFKGLVQIFFKHMEEFFIKGSVSPWTRTEVILIWLMTQILLYMGLLCFLFLILILFIIFFLNFSNFPNSINICEWVALSQWANSRILLLHVITVCILLIFLIKNVNGKLVIYTVKELFFVIDTVIKLFIFIVFIFFFFDFIFTFFNLLYFFLV